MHDTELILSCIQISAYPLGGPEMKEKNVIYSHMAFTVFGFTITSLLLKFDLHPRNVI